MFRTTINIPAGAESLMNGTDVSTRGKRTVNVNQQSALDHKVMDISLMVFVLT